MNIGEYTLKNGVDYTVSYIDNLNAGTATVEITGKGNYAGTIEKYFDIEKVNLKKATIGNLKDRRYNGKAIVQPPAHCCHCCHCSIAAITVMARSRIVYKPKRPRCASLGECSP